jgi:hypothetical protein
METPADDGNDRPEFYLPAPSSGTVATPPALTDGSDDPDMLLWIAGKK